MKTQILVTLMVFSSVAFAKLSDPTLRCVSPDESVTVMGIPHGDMLRVINNGEDSMTVVNDKMVSRLGLDEAERQFPGYMNVPIKTTTKLFNIDDANKRSFSMVADGDWKGDRPIYIELKSVGPVMLRKLPMGFDSSFKAQLKSVDPSGIQGVWLNSELNCEYGKVL